MIQLIFAEIFVPLDFTIRTTHGLSGPTNTCAVEAKINPIRYFELPRPLLIYIDNQIRFQTNELR